MTMTDIPSRDALIEAGARALCDASDADWDYVLSIEGHPLAKACRQGAAGVLDAILPLVLAGAGEALGDLDGAFIEYQADDNCPCSGCVALRRARAVLAQINTLIGESKGADTDTGTNR